MRLKIKPLYLKKSKTRYEKIHTMYGGLWYKPVGSSLLRQYIKQNMTMTEEQLLVDELFYDTCMCNKPDRCHLELLNETYNN